MAKKIGKTALWVAMTALAVNGHTFAQELGEPEPAGVEALAPAEDMSAEARFSQEQVEQMVAPVALYPDSLLAQVLMAATYPFEVAQADQWLKKNPGLEGEALDAAVAEQPWDPSVKTLAFFPSVLDSMANDLNWTQDLGDAFLAQETDVMGTVQRLRRQAQEAGNLESNAQQVVRTEGSNVVVESADPATVYVPSYNPTTVYGSSWAPATTYYPETYSTTSSLPTWVVFGAGVVVGAVLMAAIDWADDDDYYVVHRDYWPRRRHHHHLYYYDGPLYWSPEWRGPRYGRPAWHSYRPTYITRGDVYIDNSRTVNIDKTVNVRNKVSVRQWTHDPVHRGTVSYRDPATAQRFLKSTEATRLDRETVRRLDRGQRTLQPADRGTREALQGDALQRRDRIMRMQKDVAPSGMVEPRPDAAEAATRRLGRDPGRMEPGDTGRSRGRQIASPGAADGTAPAVSAGRTRPEGLDPRGDSRRQQQWQQREGGQAPATARDGGGSGGAVTEGAPTPRRADARELQRSRERVAAPPQAREMRRQRLEAGQPADVRQPAAPQTEGAGGVPPADARSQTRERSRESRTWGRAQPSPSPGATLENRTWREPAPSRQRTEPQSAPQRQYAPQRSVESTRDSPLLHREQARARPQASQPAPTQQRTAPQPAPQRQYTPQQQRAERRKAPPRDYTPPPQQQRQQARASQPPPASGGDAGQANRGKRNRQREVDAQSTN